MIEIPTNPTLETLKIVLYVALGIITVMALIIAYFFRQRESGESARMSKIEEIVATIEKTVNNLDKIVALIKSRQEDSDPRTEKRLNEHSMHLKRHDRQLARIETNLKIKYKEE